MNYIFNIFFYSTGILFMILNKLRYALRGYRTPRPFSTVSIEKCVEYDVKVTRNWINKLNQFSKTKFCIKSKNILELGPGADLGVGLILLGMGAGRYNAVDVNPLVKSLPVEFYNKFFDYLKTEVPEANIQLLGAQLKLFYQGGRSQLNYFAQPDFSFTPIQSEKIDVILSQAAFEHFDDIERTVRESSELTVRGGYFLAVIDFQTHTRFLRERDPLNIYRYNKHLYDTLKFRGSPNRIRPKQYVEILKKYGWGNITFEPSKLAPKDYINSVKPYIHKEYRSDESLPVLSGILFAQKQ